MVEELWSRPGHSPFMWWPDWSPDGRRLATAEMRAPSVVLLLDGDSGEEVARLKGHTKAVNCCAWRGDGKRLGTAGGDGRVIVRGPRGGLKAKHHLFKDQSESVSWSPDGELLAVSARDGTVLLMEPETGNVKRSWPPGPMVLSLDWHPDRELLAVAREDAKARVMDPKGGSVLLLAHRGPVSCVRWSPDGGRLVTASADGSVRDWSTEGVLLEMLRRPDGESASSVAYSPDGKFIASGFFDGAVRVWRDGRLELEDRSGEGPVVAVAWRPGHVGQLTVGRSKGALRLLEL